MPAGASAEVLCQRVNELPLCGLLLSWIDGMSQGVGDFPSDGGMLVPVQAGGIV
jgi:hypothetical protein